MIHLLLIAVLLSFPSYSKEVKKQQLPLSISKLNELKKKPCALVHVWATWCLPCIEEIPHYVPFVNKAIKKMPKIVPVTIDVSRKLQRDSFSTAFITGKDPNFPVYYKKKGSMEAYITAIDKEWEGALPYTVLYVNGVKKKAWQSETKFSELDKALNSLCK